jgi:homoserine O-acetyltransferase
VKAALTADDAYQGGWYEIQPAEGLRAMARVYAGWGFSQAFYREKLDLEMGFASLEDFLIGLLGGALPATRRQQPVSHAVDLAEGRHQRQ